jgi:hypothetical protein
MVVADWDVTEARRMGLDQTDIFKEDRLNFLRFQILEVYEKEKLWPLISISEDDVDRRFRATRASMITVKSCDIGIRHFDTEQDAIEAEARPGNDTFNIYAGDLYKRSKISSADQSLLYGHSPFYFLRLHERALAGVFTTKTGADLIVRGKDLETETPPLARLSISIRNDLEHEAVERAEIELAQKCCANLAIVDKIDYARYGASRVTSPWSK